MVTVGAFVLVLATLTQPASARNALLAADKALSDSSVRCGIGCALGAAFTEDALYLHSGAPVIRGGPAARAHLAAQAHLIPLQVQWQALHAEVSQDESRGVTWGVVVISPRAGGPARFGKYLTAWRRDGTRWLVEANVFAGLNAPDQVTWPAGWHLPELPSLGERSAFAAADRSFAARARQVAVGDAFAEFAAPDAVTFPGSGEVARGPAAIRAALSSQAGSVWIWHPVGAGGAADGSLGWTVGEATITAKDRDGRENTNLGKYLTIWRRQADGSVKFIADLGNTRAAAPQ